MKKHPVKIAVFVLLAALSLSAALIPSVREQLSMDAVRAKLDLLSEWGHRPWGPIAYVAAGIAFMLLQLPGLVPVILGALIYDPVTAFFLSTVSSVTGSMLTFWLFRYLLIDWAAPRLKSSPLGPHIERFESHGVRWMIALRVVFALSPWLNWMIGATRVPTRDYALGNAVGIAIVVFAVQLVTDILESVGNNGGTLGRVASIVVIFCVFFLSVAVLRRTLLKTPPTDA